MIIYNPEQFINLEFFTNSAIHIESQNPQYFWLEHYGPKSPLCTQVQSLKQLTQDLTIHMLWEDTQADQVSRDMILRRIKAQIPGDQEQTIDEQRATKIMEAIESFIGEQSLVRVNLDHPDYQVWEEQNKVESQNGFSSAGEGVKKARVHVLGLGDVGSTMALALSLYGGEAIGEIGLYDLDENRLSRWEQEINQIAEPLIDHLPKVKILREEDLFDCDLFAFTASVGVPPVGVEGVDVRVVQFNGNAKLVSLYGRLAVEKDFKGIFAVVSDPVDQLCRHLYESTNKSENGHWHGQGLRTEQIRGYGLGVMNGRAAYFAKQNDIEYGSNGRVYGPHGKGLVVANHWDEKEYLQEASLLLTEQTITANLEMRRIGYKPYIAPAVASGAIAITNTLLGKWHYSCISFDGFYYGCLNKRLGKMDVWEQKNLALALRERIVQSSEELKTQWESL